MITRFQSLNLSLLVMRTKKRQRLFRNIGVVLGILYFAQIGLVPLLHFHEHVKHTDNEDHNSQCHHSESASQTSDAKPVLFLSNKPAENHSEGSSHDEHNCTICSSVSLFAISVKSAFIPSDTYSSIISLHYTDNIDAEYLDSSHSPRGPPSFFQS